MPDHFSFAIGLASESPSGTMLDCFFPCPVIDPEPALSELVGQSFSSGVSQIDTARARAFGEALPAGALRENTLALCEADRPLTAVSLAEDLPISSTAEAYLKLHLLSHRLALPNTLNLESIFTHLPNVAWTSEGPVAIETLPARILAARQAGRHLEVQGVDKFPRMTNYVVPSGVRIADASRIRLGAYLGEGTTVMHEGYVNFNAGALGPNMIEGRVSQGVIIGANSDLGGSASTMGTLSGGGEIVISIGENCLIGANAGSGIPLGDRCTIEAGLYITAGTRVMVIDEHGDEVRKVKARELAGASDLLFIRNSELGRIECRTNRRAIELNAKLHAHN